MRRKIRNIDQLAILDHNTFNELIAHTLRGTLMPLGATTEEWSLRRIIPATGNFEIVLNRTKDIHRQFDDAPLITLSMLDDRNMMPLLQLNITQGKRCTLGATDTSPEQQRHQGIVTLTQHRTTINGLK